MVYKEVSGCISKELKNGIDLEFKLRIDPNVYHSAYEELDWQLRIATQKAGNILIV